MGAREQSRISFDDRGTSEPKGVPGQWTVYLVTEQEQPQCTHSIEPADVAAAASRRQGCGAS
jgi:hypothetical protein